MQKIEKFLWLCKHFILSLRHTLTHSSLALLWSNLLFEGGREVMQRVMMRPLQYGEKFVPFTSLQSRLQLTFSHILRNWKEERTTRREDETALQTANVFLWFFFCCRAKTLQLCVWVTKVLVLVVCCAKQQNINRKNVVFYLSFPEWTIDSRRERETSRRTNQNWCIIQRDSSLFYDLFRNRRSRQAKFFKLIIPVNWLLGKELMSFRRVRALQRGVAF